MIAQTTDLDAFDLVVFGGTGDLARRKLIPALFHRELEDQLPPDSHTADFATSSILAVRAYGFEDHAEKQ